jgi:pimeloyl-ACP methyl ester carboxylesterase
VYVPEAHRFGETGMGFWGRLLRFDLRDDRLRLQHVERQERDTFFADIHQAMQVARDSGKQPHALLFLHGFNVTFTDAAIRAAQIGYDLKVLGATAFFSWPSRGSVAAYPVDEASIEASERAITDFLVNFTVHCGAEKVHLIAHSMGNCGLLRALLRIAAQAPGQVKFGQVFLAALRILPTLHRGSWHRHGGRAGFDIDLLGHAYFAQAEAWLHDIHDLMRHNEAPAQRQRITPAVHEGTAFWRLRR